MMPHWLRKRLEHKTFYRNWFIGQALQSPEFQNIWNKAHDVEFLKRYHALANALSNNQVTSRNQVRIEPIVIKAGTSWLQDDLYYTLAVRVSILQIDSKQISHVCYFSVNHPYHIWVAKPGFHIPGEDYGHWQSHCVEPIIHSWGDFTWMLFKEREKITAHTRV